MKTKRNLWPAFVIAAFGLFAAGMATLVVIACNNGSDLVRQDYYEEELRFQSQLDRLNRSTSLAQQVSIVYDTNAQQIVVSLPRDHASSFPEGGIELYRPSSSQLDKRIALAVDQKGTQSLDARTLVAGLWKVRVHWNVNSEEFFSDQPIVISHPN
jgi:hypothetical protein